MVWKCSKEGMWMYWTKDDEYGAVRKEEKRKNVYGCSEGQHTEGWCDGGRFGKRTKQCSKYKKYSFEDSHTGLQILMHTRKFINNLHWV